MPSLVDGSRMRVLQHSHQPELLTAKDLTLVVSIESLARRLAHYDLVVSDIP